jgi:hypothetical protein
MLRSCSAAQGSAFVAHVLLVDEARVSHGVRALRSGPSGCAGLIDAAALAISIALDTVPPESAATEPARARSTRRELLTFSLLGDAGAPQVDTAPQGILPGGASCAIETFDSDAMYCITGDTSLLERFANDGSETSLGEALQTGASGTTWPSTTATSTGRTRSARAPSCGP